jgi:hypothetical protein
MMSPIRAGQGADSLRLVNFADPRAPSAWAGSVTVDLDEDRVRIDRQASRVSDLENVEVSDFIRAVLRGNAEDNHFVVGLTCLAKLYGRGGDDTLRGLLSGGRCSNRIEGPRAVRAFGGAGNDTLVGRKTADRLAGGSGTDSGDGRGNIDVCTTETRRNCER